MSRYSGQRAAEAVVDLDARAEALEARVAKLEALLLVMHGDAVMKRARQQVEGFTDYRPPGERYWNAP